MKNRVRLSESQLINIVSKAIKSKLLEMELPQDIGNEEAQNYTHWYDEVEETYDMVAMIKSDFNPIQYTVNAKSIQEAIAKGMEHFVKFTGNGEKDVDIYYIKHHGYDGV